jgi:REP element-mobilizing transposase RayT
MDKLESLSHSKWECNYHIVFIPKCRRKTLYKELRPHLGEVFRQLARQKECRIEEGHLMVDHVHILISIPPKYAVTGGCGRLPQREKSRACSACVRRAETPFYGAAFLGAGLLRFDGRSGQDGDP